MMLVVFAAMAVALVAAQGARPRTAAVCAFVGLLLAAALFLFEVYDPVDGFRLPWLQVRAAPAVPGEPA